MSIILFYALVAQLDEESITDVIIISLYEVESKLKQVCHLNELNMQ
jgi:hypothetical protein